MSHRAGPYFSVVRTQRSQRGCFGSCRVMGERSRTRQLRPWQLSAISWVAGLAGGSCQTGDSAMGRSVGGKPHWDRSNAIVEPSGSCSSSALLSREAATIS
jgi:hypothetical protein